jgi:hypothetical protein
MGSPRIHRHPVASALLGEVERLVGVFQELLYPLAGRT